MTCSKSRSRKKESWSRQKRNQKGRYDEFIWKQESKFADCCTGSSEPEEPEKQGKKPQAMRIRTVQELLDFDGITKEGVILKKATTPNFMSWWTATL